MGKRYLCPVTTQLSSLQWDFEDANAQWNKLLKENVDGFPLQEWPKNPSPKPTCSCGGII